MQINRLIFVGAVIVSAVAAWWSSHQWLTATGRFSDWRIFLWPLLFVVIYAAVASLALTLLQSRWDRLAVITSSWAAFVLFFPASIWYLSALPVFFLFWMDASRRNRRELEERYKLRIRRVVGPGVKFVLLGIFLMISLGFYSLPVGGDITPDSVGDGLQRSVDNAYDTSFVQNQLSGLSTSLRAQSQQRVAGYVQTIVVRWLTPIAPFLPPLLALGLFLLLWGFIGLMREPVLWVSSGLFFIMKRTGFVSIKEQQVSKEVVLL